MQHPSLEQVSDSESTTTPEVLARVGLTILNFKFLRSWHWYYFKANIQLEPLDMRQSIAPTRISQSGSLAQSNNTAAISRLQEKKKEFEAVAALERASALFLKRIEGLADDCDVMADAGQGFLLLSRP